MKKISLIMTLFYALTLFSSTSVFAETNTAPSVSIMGLSNGTAVSTEDKLTVTAQITDDISVADVKLYINGETVADNPTPEGNVYTFSDITLNNIGDVKVEVIATDNDGAEGTDAVTLTAVKSTDLTLVSLDFEDGNKKIDSPAEGIGSITCKIGAVEEVSDETRISKVLKFVGSSGNGNFQLFPGTAGTEGRFVLSADINYTLGATIKFQIGRSEYIFIDKTSGAISYGGETNYSGEWHNLKFVVDTDADLLWFYIDGTLKSSESGTACGDTLTEFRTAIVNLASDSDCVMFDNIHFTKEPQLPYPISVQQSENSFVVEMSDSVIPDTLNGNIDVYYGENNEKYELESISYDDTTKKITLTPKTPVISSLTHKIEMSENVGAAIVPAIGIKSVKYFDTQSVASDVCDFAFVKNGDTVGATATIHNTTSEQIVISMVMVLIDSDGAVDKDGVYIETVTVPVGGSQPAVISPVAVDGNTAEVFFIDDSFKSFKNYIYK